VFWSAAGSEAPRRFAIREMYPCCIGLFFGRIRAKSVSALRSATALHIENRVAASSFGWLESIMPERTPSWPHAPTHQLAEAGTFFVTAATYGKVHHFAGRSRVGVLHRGLLKVAQASGWQLEAWAVFSNHYHFIAHSPVGAKHAGSLRVMLGRLHERTAKWINRLEGSTGQKIWHNFWETRLTYEKSYRARLNYVHNNAVRHGLVTVANQYPWCSAGWFERTATPAQIKTIYSFKTDQLHLGDDYDVSRDW
jgi:putative transposase